MKTTSPNSFALTPEKRDLGGAAEEEPHHRRLLEEEVVQEHLWLVQVGQEEVLQLARSLLLKSSYLWILPLGGTLM